MAALGLANRQIRNTTAPLRRQDSGQIPEMCSALDLHGLIDLKTALIKHSSFTSVYVQGDEPFPLGTPQQLLSSIERT